MKNLYTLLLFVFSVCITNSQALYETIESKKLDGSRELKIQLPRNYDSDSKRSYPLVIVLDGDYLFEPVAGNIDYQAYWEDIPDCIVVGVKQGNTREDDFYYDDDNFLPIAEGANFYEFLASELIPYIENMFASTA